MASEKNPAALDIELRHLEWVVVLSEELHFSRAAKRLFTSRAALSDGLREIERKLGSRLFDRTTRRVLLTHAGRVFVVHARIILYQVQQALELVRICGNKDGASR